MTDRRSQARTVVIYDGCPVYRLGLSVAVAEAGFTVLEADDRGRCEAEGALVTFEDAEVPDGVLALQAECPSAVMTALLAKPSLDAFRAAFHAGAVGAVARDGSLEDIVASLSAALDGRALVPSGILAALLVGVRAGSPPAIASDQTDWLRRMARGDTVSEIATDAGYSERAMYRHLRVLYSRLGARNRTEALVCAVQHGLLAESAAFWQHPASESAHV